jgi:CRP/FNR family transcriptional regulator, cyclic AMP receptor protein
MKYRYDELLPMLSRTSVFAGLPENGLRSIVEQCDVVASPAGSVLIRQGTPATEIFIILQGKVKIILNLEKDPLEICEFDAGNCIGEASVIGIIDHSASVVVVEDAKLLVLSRKVLMHAFDTDKEFFSYLILNLARELARRLHKTDEMLLAYLKGNK